MRSQSAAASLWTFKGVGRVLTGADEGHIGFWTVIRQQSPRGESAPWHRLMMVQGEPYIIVDVCLFGRWRYLVFFLGLSWTGPRQGVGFDPESGGWEAKTLDGDPAAPSVRGLR